MRLQATPGEPQTQGLSTSENPPDQLLSAQVLLLRAIPIRECWAWHSEHYSFYFPDPLHEALSPTSPFYR